MNNTEVTNIFDHIATSTGTATTLCVDVLPDVPEVANSSSKAVIEPQLQIPLNAQLAQIRRKPTNAGDLVADALLFVALDSSTKKIVALVNSGAIRGGVFSPKTLTPDDIATLLPFSDRVVQFPAISAAIFKGVLENAVSDRELVTDPLVSLPLLDGRFGQVAGFSFTYDPVQPEGKRVISAVLDDGTKLIANGSVVSGAPDISLVTIGFVAAGGDGYPLAGILFEDLNITPQAAVTNYVTQELDGLITAQAYPDGGNNGRILALSCITKPAPSWSLLPLGTMGAISDTHHQLASVA